MANNRVVVTGLGVVAPNAIDIQSFRQALASGKSGIEFIPQLDKLNFSCKVGGIPQVKPERLEEILPKVVNRQLDGHGIQYGCLAGIEAWDDAGLRFSEKDGDPIWNAGCIFGTGQSGLNVIRDGVYTVDEGNVKRLGSTLIQNTMPSGVSAYLNQVIGFGNHVMTNASACSTGTESILLGYNTIKYGEADIMLCGSADAHGPYAWGGFDSMRVLTRKWNDEPARASRPMSQSASGFVPGAGAGAMVLESLRSALNRNAMIYGEVLGGYANSGGQRHPGSMTAPNSKGVIQCIKTAIERSNIDAREIDLINGHLTSTKGDPKEIDNWKKALKVTKENFPKVNALKSMIGHCLSASGSIECVASILQLHGGFIHPTLNCEDIHEDISQAIPPEHIPQTVIYDNDLSVIAKASFGFGDVNCVVIFKKFKHEG